MATKPSRSDFAKLGVLVGVIVCIWVYSWSKTRWFESRIERQHKVVTELEKLSSDLEKQVEDNYTRREAEQAIDKLYKNNPELKRPESFEE